MHHGNLSVNIPKNIFKGITADIDEEKFIQFKTLTRQRYPWLSENSVDVLIKKAKIEYVRIIDEESKGHLMCKKLESDGKINLALKHIKKYLEQYPNDADSWYVYGELLCKAGNTEEGYKAFAKGRDLF